jgi:hypothetical protein
MTYEDFHIVAVKDVSDRLAERLRRAGVRIEQRTLTETGRPEYAIAVHPDDIAQAERCLSEDIGPGRTVESNGEPEGR